MVRMARRSVGLAAVAVALFGASFGAGEDARADALFCRKPKAEVERLQLELGQVRLEVDQVRDELKARDQAIATLTGQLADEQARVRSLKSEIARLRGEEVEISECSAFSPAEMKLAPVGLRCRYGLQANAIAEKVASDWTSHAWRDSSGLVWDLGQSRGKTHWITAYQVCKDQGARLPKMGDFRRAEASGFLKGVINSVRGYDEVHTGYDNYTATLSSPIRFEYKLSAGVWGDFSFMCAW